MVEREFVFKIGNGGGSVGRYVGSFGLVRRILLVVVLEGYL